MQKERGCLRALQTEPHLICSHSHVFGTCSFLGISKLKTQGVTNVPHKNPKKDQWPEPSERRQKGKAKAFNIMTLKFNPS